MTAARTRRGTRDRPPDDRGDAAARHLQRLQRPTGHQREFAEALQAITPGLRLDLLPGRQGGPGEDPYLDTTRLAEDTGVAPTFDVAAAVADYVAWRADHPR